nr:hypothetical protein [Streptomyces apocyni]
MWVVAVFGPRTRGRHRSRPTVPAPPGTVPPRPEPSWPPAPRSPYGLDTPLDGSAVASVRPYLAACEQRQRRLALVLAADFGIDLDQHLVGAGGAA